MSHNSFIKREFEQELKNNILPYWMKNAPDTKNGGFYGFVSNSNAINNNIPRTSVSCARILWTFSHAYLMDKKEEYLHTAKMAYDYLNSAFWDNQNNGLFWSVDKHGNPASDHKQYYAQAFGIYGYSEYFRATLEEASLKRAMHLFQIIEENAFDEKYGGYIEGSSRNFSPLADMRLSAKDMNCRKSMNTLLHIMEAYTNLLRVWENQKLREQLQRLMIDFTEHVVDHHSKHFSLFFDDEWNPLSDHISAGHEIEGSWLLCEAADILGNQGLLDLIHSSSLQLAESVLTCGIDEDGSIIHEGTIDHVTNPDKEWWTQAEAVIGFYNAYQLSGDSKYLKASLTCWEFIKTNLVDTTHGGWFKRLKADGSIDPSSPKIGPWESSYHESRLCYEMIKRLSVTQKSDLK